MEHLEPSCNKKAPSGVKRRRGDDLQVKAICDDLQVKATTSEDELRQARTVQYLVNMAHSILGE